MACDGLDPPPAPATPATAGQPDGDRQPQRHRPGRTHHPTGPVEVAQGTGGGRRRAAVRASRPWPAPDALWHDPVQPRPARAHRDGAGAAEPRGDAQRQRQPGAPRHVAGLRAEPGAARIAGVPRTLPRGPGGTARRHHERPSRTAGETPARCGGGAPGQLCAARQPALRGALQRGDRGDGAPRSPPGPGRRAGLGRRGATTGSSGRPARRSAASSTWP